MGTACGSSVQAVEIAAELLHVEAAGSKVRTLHGRQRNRTPVGEALLHGPSSLRPKGKSGPRWAAACCELAILRRRGLGRSQEGFLTAAMHPLQRSWREQPAALAPEEAEVRWRVFPKPRLARRRSRYERAHQRSLRCEPANALKHATAADRQRQVKTILHNMKTSLLRCDEAPVS